MFRSQRHFREQGSVRKVQGQMYIETTKSPRLRKGNSSLPLLCSLINTHENILIFARIKWKCAHIKQQDQETLGSSAAVHRRCSSDTKPKKIEKRKIVCTKPLVVKNPGRQKNRGKNPKKNFARSFATPTCELVTSSQNYKCTSTTSTTTERKLDPLIEPPGGAKNDGMWPTI